jgi:putative chitinase
MTLKLTPDIIATGCGCSSLTAATWIQAIQEAIDQFGISNTAPGTAAFLANVGVESAGLSVLSENLHYSAQGLARTWPQRYAVSPLPDNKIPNDTAVRLAALGPQAIANNVYANRLGNGSEQSGDGWNFRGQGLIQITGRDMYMKFFAAFDLPLDTDPSEVGSTTLGAASAAWFFASQGPLDFAVQGNFDCSVKEVNGQMPCAANQGDLRQSRYAAVLPLCTAAMEPAPTQPSKKGQQKAQTTPPAPQ